MHEYIAAIDQGTTSTRCILFNNLGEIKASAQKEHKQIYPRPGWVEHNPLEIWERTQEVVGEAIATSGGDSSSIAAVGITNQRETTVLWDRSTGEPYTNAIVWQDTRTKPICDRLAAEGGIDRFRSQVGLPLATYFSGPKIQWILENNPPRALNKGRLCSVLSILVNLVVLRWTEKRCARYRCTMPAGPC
jgi:glycerol kinase